MYSLWTVSPSIYASSIYRRDVNLFLYLLRCTTRFLKFVKVIILFQAQSGIILLALSVPWPCFFNLQTQCPFPVKAKALQCTPGILGLKSLAPSFVITIGLHWCIHGNIITQSWLSKHPSSNVNTDCNNNGTAMTPLMNISVLQLVANLRKLSTFLRDKIALTHGLGCPKFYMSICTFLVHGSILIIPFAHSCLLCLCAAEAIQLLQLGWACRKHMTDECNGER